MRCINLKKILIALLTVLVLLGGIFGVNYFNSQPAAPTTSTTPAQDAQQVAIDYLTLQINHDRYDAEGSYEKMLPYVTERYAPILKEQVESLKVQMEQTPDRVLVTKMVEGTLKFTNTNQIDENQIIYSYACDRNVVVNNQAPVMVQEEGNIKVVYVDGKWLVDIWSQGIDSGARKDPSSATTPNSKDDSVFKSSAYKVNIAFPNTWATTNTQTNGSGQLVNVADPVTKNSVSFMSKKLSGKSLTVFIDDIKKGLVAQNFTIGPESSKTISEINFTVFQVDKIINGVATSQKVYISAINGGESLVLMATTSNGAPGLETVSKLVESATILAKP